MVNTKRDGDRVIVEWNTAMSGPEPIRSYNILAGTKLVASLPFRPQLTEAPLWAPVLASEVGSAPLTVVASEEMPKRIG